MAGISIADVILVIISAFSGAWANGWYRDQEVKKALKRELEGLLYLIDAELYDNELKLQALIRGPNLIKYPSLVAPTNEDWNQAKHRLTQLKLPARDIASLVAYYQVAQKLTNAVHDSKEWASVQEGNETISEPALVGDETITDLAYILLRQGKQTRRMVREYLADPPTYPVEIPPASDSGP